jgi:hypothetical protein
MPVAVTSVSQTSDQVMPSSWKIDVGMGASSRCCVVDRCDRIQFHRVLREGRCPVSRPPIIGQQPQTEMAVTAPPAATPIHVPIDVR